MGVHIPTTSARLHQTLGTCLDWWGWHGAAQQAYRDALRADPQSAEALAGLAESLGHERQWHTAARHLEHAVRLRPHDPELHGNLVLALARARHWRRAVVAIDGLIRVRPHEPETLVLRGALLARLGRPAEAIRSFRSAVRLPPGPEWQRCFLGEALLGSDNWSAAQGAYTLARAVRAQAPTAPPAAQTRLPVARPARRRRTTWLRPQQGPPRAARVLHAARPGWLGQAGSVACLALLVGLGVPARGETPAARERASACFSSSGEEAVAACVEALALGLRHDRAAIAQRLLAAELAALRRWNEMVEAYRGLVRLRPEDPEARYRLGRALLQVQGQPAAAVRELERATALREEEPRYLGALGVALNAVGRHAEALAALERAAALDPRYLAAHPAAAAALAASREGRTWP